jgi:fructose-specific component phosphotransferase system IIB-like protein
MDRFPDIRDLPIFCAVARLGSFAKTATELAVSTSYVGKRIEITGLRRTICDPDNAIAKDQTTPYFNPRRTYATGLSG